MRHGSVRCAGYLQHNSVGCCGVPATCSTLVWVAVVCRLPVAQLQGCGLSWCCCLNHKGLG